MRKEPIEVNLNTAPLCQSSIIIKGALRRAIAKQEIEALAPGHTQPAEWVSVGNKLINSVGEVKPDIRMQ